MRALFVKINLYLFLLLFLVPYFLHAQATQTYIEIDKTFKEAKDLFAEKRYNIAYPLFTQLYLYSNRAIDRVGTPDQLTPLMRNVQLEITFYYIVCELNLYIKTAEADAKEFLITYHVKSWTGMMISQLAKFYMHERRYTEALALYDSVDRKNLSNEEIAEMTFSMGYCYFVKYQLDTAKKYFDILVQVPTFKYYNEANYYEGFILFNQQKYDSALLFFKRIVALPQYKNILPYYIAQLYALKGDLSQATTYAETVFKQNNQYYSLLLMQLLGNGYYEERKFADALPYLSSYVKQASKVSRIDLYELSFCYYQTQQWLQAIDGFKQLGGKEDSLAQNSMYLLADIYLKTGQRNEARNAFLFCASNSANPTQKEISQFNYAKLSFELGYNDVALHTTQQFLATYPESVYKNEAKELLVDIMSYASNYKDALVVFDSLPHPSEQVKMVYPRILYNYITELINDQHKDEALTMLNRLEKVPYNKKYLPYLNFWKGELLYEEHQPKEATDYILQYLRNPIVLGECNVLNASYNLGYCYLETEHYSSAATYFLRVSGESLSSQSTPMQQDAYIRMGDAFFMLKNYTKANRIYSYFITNNLLQADYALFQKAMIMGALNRPKEKNRLLQSLPTSFPGSPLITDAYMEMANTYLADEDYTNAISPLKTLLHISPPPPTLLLPQIYLKLGVSYFNIQDNAQALDAFTQLYQMFPNATEINDAEEYVRSIYVQQQQPNLYVDFMKKYGKTVSINEQDSLVYNVALNSYQNNSFSQALSEFLDYIKQFPEGYYIMDANYYVGQVLLTTQREVESVPYFKVVVDKVPNQYAEASMKAIAHVEYFNLKNYAEAEKYFSLIIPLTSDNNDKIDAMRGLLRCQYNLSQWKEGLDNAQAILALTNISLDDKVLATMLLAKSQQASQDTSQSLITYKSVIALGLNQYAAEAAYDIALIYFQQNNLKEAEKQAFMVIHQLGAYDRWVTKSYILLGRIYWAENDYFNAEATLKSVVGNADIDELKIEAQSLLNQIIADQQQHTKVE